MPAMLKSVNAQIVIIGCGISGITAAQRLVKAGFHHVRILEATARSGGRIKTGRLGERLFEATWLAYLSSQQSRVSFSFLPFPGSFALLCNSFALYRNASFIGSTKKGCTLIGAYIILHHIFYSRWLWSQREFFYLACGKWDSTLKPISHNVKCIVVF